MQRLFFEDAWENTISPQDRKNIQAAFDQGPMGDGVTITYLWEAKNHLNALLVTTLIHNHTDKTLILENKNIQYKTRTKTFSLPVTIPAYHSMPWTFIFDRDGVDEPVDYVITKK